MYTAILTKEQIDGCFIGKTEQTEPLLELFKTVIPNWDNVDGLNHFPQVHKKTWHYICDKFLKVNRNSGFFWVNYGFGSMDENVKEWKVLIDKDKITYKEE